jgi:hypothetical protein
MADLTPLLGLNRVTLRDLANRLDVMGGLIATFAPDDATTDPTTLTFGYRGGRFIDDLGAIGFEPDGTIVIPNNVIRYVQFDPTNGVVLTSAIDRTKLLIAQVRTGSQVPVGSPAGTVMHIEDLRDTNLVAPERMRFRGLWDSGDNYERNDLVLSGASGADLYIAVAASTNQEPPNATYWELVAFGLPDPASGDPGDVPAVNAGGDGYELVAPGGGSTLDVEDEGSLEESAVERINFHGAGVSAVGDGVGGVDVEIAGGTSPGSGAGTHPAGPLPDPAAMEVFVDANDVGGAADGANVATLTNQGTAGAAKDLLNGAGTGGIYRAADPEDGLPFIEYDGTTHHNKATGLTAYTGTELTFYIVVRSGVTGTTSRFFALTKVGAVDDNNAGTFVLRAVTTQYRKVITRQNVSYECNNQVQAQAVAYDAFSWSVIAGRWKVVTVAGVNRAVLTMLHNNRLMVQDLGGASLTAFDIRAIFLGAGSSSGDGVTANLFAACDIRHFSYDHSAHTIEQMRDTLRRLAADWKVPILD